MLQAGFYAGGRKVCRMRRKPRLLAVNIVALALAITALLAACLYLMLPTIGYVWTWARILTLITTVPMFWLLVGGTLTGVLAAVLQKRGDFVGHGLGALCLIAGLGLGLYAWLPAELSFASGIIPDGYPPGHARIIFMGVNYVVALTYAVLGLVGSAAVLGALRARRGRLAGEPAL